MALNQKCYVLTLILLSVVVTAYGEGYGPSGYGQEPKVNYSKTKQIQFLPQVFSVQGIIYCKSDNKVFPLKGGLVRISCLGMDKYGYETAPFSILTRPTDGNGYFLAKLSSQPQKYEDCRAFQCNVFLQSSPNKSCQFATNVNGGLTGTPLSVYRPVGSNKMRLYSVGPFLYTSQAQSSTPTGY